MQELNPVEQETPVAMENEVTEAESRTRLHRGEEWRREGNNKPLRDPAKDKKKKKIAAASRRRNRK